MQRLRIGFGLSLGLLLGASLMHCSFYLPERTVCTSGDACKAGDMGTPPDLAKDPNDPSVSGPYAVATLALPGTPPGINDQVLLGPSDDGSGISGHDATYPLILIAPASSVSVASMRQYADRLVTHGFIVGVYQVSDQSNHLNYRDTALGYLSYLQNNTDASIKTRIDSNHIGLMGYQLGGKISIAMATQNPSISALFLMDPVDVLATMGAIDGTAEIAKLTLAGGNSVALIGEPLSVMGSQPCVQSPQKGYADFYAAARSPALSIDFGNANLGDFVENYPDDHCTMGSTAPHAQTQGLAMKFSTAYFQWALKGQTREREYLLGADFFADAQSARLTRSSK